MDDAALAAHYANLAEESEEDLDEAGVSHNDSGSAFPVAEVLLVVPEVQGDEDEEEEDQGATAVALVGSQDGAQDVKMVMGMSCPGVFAYPVQYYKMLMTMISWWYPQALGGYHR